MDQRGCGAVFTPRDLVHIGDQGSVAMALTRLTRKGMIRSLARGLYYYPLDHPVLGTLSASNEAIIQAIANRDSLRVQPTGNYALNLLGLSEQVPMKVAVLTDGPSRHIKIGHREIIFKHTTPKNMATAGRTSGIIIQALRCLGNKRVDDEVLAILNRRLNINDRKQLEEDIRYAPVWMHKLIHFIAGQNSESIASK